MSSSIKPDGWGRPTVLLGGNGGPSVSGDRRDRGRVALEVANGLAVVGCCNLVESGLLLSED